MEIRKIAMKIDFLESKMENLINLMRFQMITKIRERKGKS